MQSFGPNGCSLKPDSNIGVVVGLDEVNGRCGYAPPPPDEDPPQDEDPPTEPDDTPISQTAPEPITMVLLGSGLLGVGAARRRRRNQDEMI